MEAYAFYDVEDTRCPATGRKVHKIVHTVMFIGEDGEDFNRMMHECNRFLWIGDYLPGHGHEGFQRYVLPPGNSTPESD